MLVIYLGLTIGLYVGEVWKVATDYHVAHSFYCFKKMHCVDMIARVNIKETILLPYTSVEICSIKL